MSGLGSILVVEDDAAVRYAIVRNLSKVSEDVVAVENGSEALEVLGQRAFETLICDLRLPGLGGDAVCREARREFPELKIVAISGFASQGARVRLETLGVAFLPKPFRSGELLETIRKARTAEEGEQ